MDRAADFESACGGSSPPGAKWVPAAARRFAGERTRTSKGASPPGPKPGASTSSATPAWLKDRAAGYQSPMADQEQREQESRESDVTKFEERTDEQSEEREELAERLDEPLPSRED